MTKVVGVVGGMGPQASSRFYADLIRLTAAERDQDHLHVIVDSDAAIPDRTEFLIHGGSDPRPALKDAARRLVRAGADLLVMPCNTAAAFSDDVRMAAGVPLIDWIDTAVESAVGSGADTVGLLATSGTLAADLYQERLDAAAVGWVVPSPSIQEGVMQAIYGPHGVKSGGADQVGQEGLLRAAEELSRGGADVAVLGCTELPLAIAPDDPRWPIAVIDPSEAVAKKVIREAGGRVKPSEAP